METGNAVYEKNSNQIIYPASTVKIMTAILVVENVPDLNSQTLISQYVVDNTIVTSKNIGVSVGEVFTVEQLLNAMLLYGANDAALALAEYVSGSVPDFVAKMNEKAAELGCVNTVFTNPSGLHDDSMHTTAADIAKIAAYATKNQVIMDITSSDSFDIPPTNKDSDPRPLFNRNYFTSKASGTNSDSYYPYAKGINAGNTSAAGYCLVTLAQQAQQNELSYLCVVMGSTAIPSGDTEIPNSYSDAHSLLDWAFSIYSYKTIVSTKDKISSPEVRLSANRDTVTLVPDADISVLLPQNVNMDKDIEIKSTTYTDSLVAPISVGDCLGEITVWYKGQIVGSAKLLSTAAVERSNVLYALDQIKGIVSCLWFKASVTIFIILFAVYIVIILLRNNRKTPRKFY